MPISRTCSTNASVVSSTSNPGIASSLSSVPPVCPSPRPLIFPNGTPQAATIGPTASVVLSPTPPVECLSTTRRPSARAEVDRLAAPHHRVGERERLRGREPLEVDGHQKRGDLVVRHVAARVLEHELRDLVPGELVAVALALDQLGGADHGVRIGWPGMPRDGRLPVQPGVHGRADVGELALVDPARSVSARDVREQHRVLARVVGRRRRGIAAVVGREDQQVAGPQRLEQVRQPAVEVLEAAVEVDRVVAVPPERVRLDEVHEDEAVVELLQQLLRLLYAVDVRLRRMRLVDVDAREDVADLADAVHLLARVAGEREVVRPLRHERVVVAVRRAHVVVGRAGERPRDHAADCVLAGEDLARDLARLVELVERHRLLVRRDLEDGVGRRVDDPLAGLLVLLAELLDDLGARRGLVAEHAAPGAVHERVDDVVREPVRIRRERLRGDDAHQLPVAGGRVLALRPLEEPARDRRRSRLRRAALELLDVPEPERLHVREIEAADGLRDVRERVRALVAVPVGVRQRAGPDGVEHDHAGTRSRGLGHPAILGSAWTTSSGYSLSSSTSPP